MQMQKIKKEIEKKIADLRKHSESSADVAQGMLDVLNNCSSTTVQDYKDYLDDIEGSLAIWK